MIQNRQTDNLNLKKNGGGAAAARNRINLFLILALLLSFGLACSLGDGSAAPANGSAGGSSSSSPGSQQQVEIGKKEKPKRLESYAVRGFKFSYYLIPKDLDREELISVAQEIRNAEPDAQLVLVDDESQVGDYVAYAKELSLGNAGANPPREWANRHIIANVQKYLSGKWMLCEGNGYREIAELK